MSNRGTRRPNKSLQWYDQVRGLPNAAYFLSEERPQDFDHVKYLTTLDLESDDRQQASNTWRDKVVPALESSCLPELQQAGHRLAKEWISKKRARDEFWTGLEEKELEEADERRKKRRLMRLKATADTMLEEAEKLLVEETRAHFEEERAKLQQRTKVSTSTMNDAIAKRDLSGREEDLRRRSTLEI